VRVSLGLRVLSLVGTINLAVFGAGLYFLSEGLERERQVQQEKLVPQVGLHLSKWVSGQGGPKVAPILQWPYWDVVTDAVIVDRNPAGVSLNPVGVVNRDPSFDREQIEADMIEASDRQISMESAGGLAFPINDRRGNPWGACWVNIEPADTGVPIWLRLLPWFLASTCALFLGTFGVLRRYVLGPVGALARGVRQVQGGDFSAPVMAPKHSDQLTDLIGTFNQMAADVHGFNEYLEHEAEAAKEKAFQAEAAALKQRRLAAMGELAAGIAHEINNPLGGMLNAVEVLDQASTDSAKRARYHDLLRGGLERIRGTVSKLLRFTPRQAELAPMELCGPVEDAMDLIRHRADQQGVRLEFSYPESLLQVRAQSSVMGQVVLNLLVNALDAIETMEHEPGAATYEGLVQVILAQDGDFCVLTVLDNGPGVPEDQLERAADLFYTTKEVGRGTGLGLALVHTVIAQHGGTVQMSNRITTDPGALGLRVDLSLPLLGTHGDGAL
jgi:signal transduction histidine kinase